MGASFVPRVAEVHRRTRERLETARECYCCHLVERAAAGLLTRAILKGYFTAGSSGLDALQWLLLVGLAINEGLASAIAKKDLEDGRGDDDDEGDEDER